MLLQRAILHGRVKDYDKALAALDDIERRREGGGLGPIEWSEKGLLLDRMGRYAEAFAAFSEGKRTLRALTGQSYLAEEAAALARRLKAFFVAPRLEDPAARRRAVRRRPADLHRRLSPLRHDDDRADA